jgi:cytoskeletal protein CcmA (bactofilin family)
MERTGHRWPRWAIVALPLATILILLAATVVLAQDTFLDGKVRAGDQVTVPASETVDGNLYIFSGTATVDGSVTGDLTVFAGTINVNGSVGGDVLAAGGTLNVAGEVGGDVRMAGGTLTADEAVTGDVLAAGGTVTIGSGGSVGGDVVVSGGQVSVNGTIEGSIEGTAGNYSRSGTVGGTENVVVRQGMWWWQEGAPEQPARDVQDDVFDALRHFVVALILGLVLIWLLPRMLRASETTLRERPAASLGGGFLALLGYVVFVIALVLLVILLAIVFGVARLGALVAVDLIGGLLTLGVGTFLFVLAIAFLADIVVGLVIGRLILPGREATVWQEIGALAIGLLLVVIVTSLPVVGGIAKLAVVLFGLGALAVAAWSRWRGRGVAVSPAVAGAPPEAPQAPPPAAPVGG